MDNWLAVFLFILFGALVNLAIAFWMLRKLAGRAGVPPEINTVRRALLSLVTILPVAGVAGAPFFIIPFMGPIFGTFISACVAPMMFAEKYELETQGEAAKIILPVVLVIYIVSAVILYFGFPLL